MESAEPRQLGTEAGLAPLAQDRASRPPGFRAVREVGAYQLDLTPEGEDLVVAFDGEDVAREPGRLPWSYRSLRDQGLAVLGVKPQQADWYRGEPLLDFFRSADFQELVGAYRKVLFTGSSMGGFAALTFCTPGSIVLAHHPQTSLHPELAPWDTRFPESRRQDWTGPFAEAVEGARQAARVFVTYDPFHEIDRLHVERLDRANLVPLKAPFLGHPLPIFLRRIGMMAELAPLALSDGLTPEWWYRTIRKRRALPRYHLIMADHLEAPDRAARLLARAWKLSAAERKTQDRIRHHAAIRKLGEQFERYIAEEDLPKVAGPAGPDEELFRRFMEAHRA